MLVSASFPSLCYGPDAVIWPESHVLVFGKKFRGCVQPGNPEFESWLCHNLPSHLALWTSVSSPIKRDCNSCLHDVHALIRCYFVSTLLDAGNTTMKWQAQLLKVRQELCKRSHNYVFNDEFKCFKEVQDVRRIDKLQGELTLWPLPSIVRVELNQSFMILSYP